MRPRILLRIQPQRGACTSGVAGQLTCTITQKPWDRVGPRHYYKTRTTRCIARVHVRPTTSQARRTLARAALAAAILPTASPPVETSATRSVLPSIWVRAVPFGFLHQATNIQRIWPTGITGVADAAFCRARLELSFCKTADVVPGNHGLSR